MPRRRTYIGSHPLAGSEKRGMASARADLLSGAKCILTSSDDSDTEVYQRLSRFWQALGMTVFRMKPDEHDAILAGVSHMPHLAAAALVATAPEAALPFAASGFRDTTRIASGEPALWREIFQANRAHTLAALENLLRELERLKGFIAQSDFEALEAYLGDAARKRGKRFQASRQEEQP